MTSMQPFNPATTWKTYDPFSDVNQMVSYNDHPSHLMATTRYFF